MQTAVNPGISRPAVAHSASISSDVPNQISADRIFFSPKATLRLNSFHSESLTPHPSPFSFPTAPSKPYLPSPHLSPITNLFVILTDPPPDFPADTSGAPFMFPARAPLPQATDRPSKEDQFCRLIDKVEEACQRAADAAMGDTEGFLLEEDDPG